MPLLIQHLLVLTLVGACVAYALRGAYRSLAGGKSRLGSCCSKGCDAAESAKKSISKDRVVFLPAELLIKSRQ